MTAAQPDWGFLLDRLIGRATGVVHALAVSADGLLIAASRGLPRDRADQVAAYTSGLASLNTGIASLMRAGPVSHNVTKMREGTILTMAIGDGSILTALATADCELGQVAYEMRVTIGSVGRALDPEPRAAAPA